VIVFDVDAYDAWRKIPEDHHMPNTQRENLEAYNKIDLS
jgi:hypothetical protein